MTIAALKTKIDTLINTNGSEAITGAIHNEILKDIVDTFQEYDITFFHQATQPTGLVNGDIWYDTTLLKLYRFNGLTWDLLQGLAAEYSESEVTIPATGLLQVKNSALVKTLNNLTIERISFKPDVDSWITNTPTVLEGIKTGGTIFNLTVKAGTTIKHNSVPTDAYPVMDSYRPILFNDNVNHTFYNDTTLTLISDKYDKVWKVLTDTNNIIEIKYSININNFTTENGYIKLTYSSDTAYIDWGDSNIEEITSNTAISHSYTANGLYNVIIYTNNSVTLLDVNNSFIISNLNNIDLLNNLTGLKCDNNSISNLDIQSKSINSLYFNDNSQTDTEVDIIWNQLNEVTNELNGIANGGGSNAAPTAASLAARNNLIANGWTLTI